MKTLQKPTVNEIRDAILDPNTTHWNGVKLPTPQTSGTLYQQATYATDKAREFVENFGE